MAKHKKQTPFAALLAAANIDYLTLAANIRASHMTIRRYADGERTPSISTARSICLFLSRKLKRTVSLDEAFPEKK